MAATVAGILLRGTHAARPAAADPPVGSLYMCTDHLLIYYTDGATWATWASLSTASLDFGEVGDISASAPGDTASAGATAEIADAAHRHAREAWGTTADMPASAPGDAENAGSSGKVSDAGHVHGRESYATITANLDYGEAGDITTSAPGDAASAGSTGEVADAGHRHGREAADKSTLLFVIDGGGSAITTGVKGDVLVNGAWTITAVTLLADQSGSIVVDIWKDTYANYPPTDADSITAAAVPTISAATKSQDTTLTGWTTSITSGDTLRFNVDSAATVTRVVVALNLTRA